MLLALIFVAPWIARKLSYLIDILGLSREVVKAMIIDAARDWNEKPTPEEVALYGNGIVPIKIADIVRTRDDEFIKNCTLNGWLVNRIDVQNRIDIHKKVNEDVEFE